MSTVKAAGGTTNTRTSNPKYRGVKQFGGQITKAGNIIIRQKGTEWRAGENTYLGKDFTVHAAIDGTIFYTKKRVIKFNGRSYVATFANVKPVVAVEAPAKKTRTTKVKA